MVRNLIRSKKAAYFFVLDAIIGILIIATTIFIISGFNTVRPTSEALNQQLDLLSTDLFETELRNIDIGSQFFFDLRQNSELYSSFITVDELVYAFVLADDLDMANKTVQNVTSWLVPIFGFNYSITYGGETKTIYYKNSSITTYDESRSSLSREKITILTTNKWETPDPAFTTVVIWR